MKNTKKNKNKLLSMCILLIFISISSISMLAPMDMNRNSSKIQNSKLIQPFPSDVKNISTKFLNYSGSDINHRVEVDSDGYIYISVPNTNSI